MRNQAQGHTLLGRKAVLVLEEKAMIGHHEPLSFIRLVKPEINAIKVK